MSCESAIRTRLLETDVGPLVGGSRIYPLLRPQGSPLPAITYQRIGEFRRDTLTQSDALTMARIQLDAWAGSYADVFELALKSQRALKHYQLGPELEAIWFETQEQLYEDETTTYRVRMDFDVWTREE
jgi:hypothetical protein